MIEYLEIDLICQFFLFFVFNNLSGALSSRNTRKKDPECNFTIPISI